MTLINEGKKMRKKMFIYTVLIHTAFISIASPQESSPISQDELLSLEKCIEIALQNQPALGTAQGQIITAESDLTQVRSLRFPQIQVEAGAYVTNTALAGNIGNAPIIDPKSGTDFIPSLRMTVKQPIYDFGRTDKAISAKQKLMQAAELSLASTEEDVILNVHIAYYNYILAQEIFQINEERVKQSRKHLERAKGFFEVGKLPESEVSKSELELANSDLELSNARGKMQLAKVSLNSAMGITELSDDLKSYNTHPNFQFELFTANLKDAISQALSSRNELTIADLRIRAGKASLASAKSQYYPIITASGGVGPYIIRNSATEAKSSTKYGTGYNVGINFAFPIFQGLSVRADIAEAQGIIRIANSQYNTTKQKIVQEVQERFFSVKIAEERYKASDKIVSQTVKNQNLAEGRFDTGVGSAIEVTDANFSVANSKIERTTALYNFLIEKARYERTIGNLKKSNFQEKK